MLSLHLAFTRPRMFMDGQSNMTAVTLETWNSCAPINAKIPEVETLRTEARALRRTIVEVLFRCGGGHYGGCLSVLDIILALYRYELRVSRHCLDAPHRDRFILSKGHAALALYAVLRHLNHISDPLEGYAEAGSPLEGHPDMTALAAIDFSSGSLGQGLSVGAGMAYALRRSSQKVWVVLGDGECQEGQVWEAAMLAASCGLHNLHVVIDSNRYQEFGRPGSPAPVSQLVEKWQSFDWHVSECDGHDFNALRAAFNTAKNQPMPSVIVAHTIKGKGVPIIEANPSRYHCSAVSPAEHALILGSIQ